MFQQLLTITRNTFTESTRQPIFVVLLLCGLGALVINPAISANTLEDDTRQMINMGMSSFALAGIFLVSFTATSVFSDEIEKRTALTVISKPVNRPVFVLGKFLGVAAALTLAYWTWAMTFLLTVRHEVLERASDPADWPVVIFSVTAALIAFGLATLGNYFYRWVFNSTISIALAVSLTIAWVLVLLINKQWQLQSPLTDIDGQLIAGLAMIFTALLFLTSVAIAASTRLGQIMTLMVCLAVAAAGTINEQLLREAADTSIVAWIVHTALPNWQLFWPADALTQEHAFALSYLAKIGLYGLMYVIATLALAVSLFQNREMS